MVYWTLRKGDGERERELKNMFKAIVMVEPAMCAHDKMMSTYVYFSWTCSIYINFIEGDIGVEDLTPQKNRTVNAYWNSGKLLFYLAGGSYMLLPEATVSVWEPFVKYTINNSWDITFDGSKIS